MKPDPSDVRAAQYPHERCELCDADLRARPVMTTMKISRMTGRGMRTNTFQKRVRKKPAQVVIALHVEGSDGTEEQLAALKRVSRWALRLCVGCVGKSVSSALAVALDKRMEEGR